MNGQSQKQKKDLADKTSPPIRKSIKDTFMIPAMKEAAAVMTDFSNRRPALQVNIDQLVPNPGQPRKTFSPAELEKLTTSIKKKGIIQPIVVFADGDKYIIAAGERRWRAAMNAGLAKVPISVRERENPSEISLTENFLREDLDHIEAAEALQRLRTDENYTHEQLADVAGKDRTTITHLLSLNQLPEEIKTDARGRKIPLNVLREILRAENAVEAYRTYLNTDTLPERKASNPRTPRKADAVNKISKFNEYLGKLSRKSFSEGYQKKLRGQLEELKATIDKAIGEIDVAAATSGK